MQTAKTAAKNAVGKDGLEILWMVSGALSMG